MQCAIKLDGARHQVDRCLSGRIQSLATYGQGALFHIECLQLALCIQHRLAGRERHIGGIDETAAITGEAIGVGHHHTSLLTSHFQIALQLRRVGTHHFVDDEIGRLTIEVGVVLNKPTQLGLGQLSGGIIEDDARLANVEILIEVVR
nr:hypothetical protein [Aeromonas jandaei]